jgi:hypothetical protein
MNKAELIDKPVDFCGASLSFDFSPSTLNGLRKSPWPKIFAEIGRAVW